jgi:KDO2-lipid IV(A) lauroyltransferase
LLNSTGILLFRFLLAFLRCLPEVLFFSLVHVVEVLFFYIFSRRLAKISAESLDIAFGGKLDAQEKARLIRNSFRHLFVGLAGFLFDYRRPDRLQHRFSLEGREHLDAALQPGRGAVIAVAHFGPFVWMLLRLAVYGYALNIVARPPRSDIFRWFFDRALSICGMNIILSVPPRTCITACLQALQRNELVVTPIDQNYGGPGRLFVDFLGRPAATAPGTGIFAQRGQSPVLFAYAVPDGQRRFRMILMPCVAPGENMTPAQIMERLTTVLETVVRRYPDQWSWMHRRWKAVPKQGERAHD